jgi:hypothetical protein
MVRYSFPVGLFHSQLHAGLSRRTDSALACISQKGLTTTRKYAVPAGAGLRARPCSSLADCCERFAARNPLTATRAGAEARPYKNTLLRESFADAYMLETEKSEAGGDERRARRNLGAACYSTLRPYTRRLAIAIHHRARRREALRCFRGARLLFCFEYNRSSQIRRGQDHGRGSRS